MKKLRCLEADDQNQIKKTMCVTWPQPETHGVTFAANVVILRELNQHNNFLKMYYH